MWRINALDDITLEGNSTVLRYVQHCLARSSRFSGSHSRQRSFVPIQNKLRQEPHVINQGVGTDSYVHESATTYKATTPQRRTFVHGMRSVVRIFGPQVGISVNMLGEVPIELGVSVAYTPHRTDIRFISHFYLHCTDSNTHPTPTSD